MSLPERSAVLVRPGTETIVCRRIVLGDPTMSAWCDLTGLFRSTAALLPALVLERGPDTASVVNQRAQGAR
jgi:hypothetical protein